ncbi:EAL domain-containing protein [Campylobacter sp. RM13119]|uniref:bifunctional diguanylate cyclase/phosphodiesterase n=1 Tax=Campylobacter californiensis TaxID=1032243 RepID=UPI0014729F03|nr:GGDEF domain-containing phosphodiesterase [Campylobacter sp. RM13119]MBE3606576.1 EAL domain-containing protein [Campylobacter sp. RM13119]
MTPHLIKFLTSLITIIFLICSFNLYKLNQVSVVNDKISSEILNLKLINKDIDNGLEHNIFSSSLDKLNDDIKKFSTALTALKEINTKTLSKGFYDLSAKIEGLDELYLQKQLLIDKSNYISSSIMSFIYIGEHEAKKYELQDFDSLFLKLRSIIAFNAEKPKSIEADIDLFFSMFPKDQNILKMINSAKYALNLSYELDEILNKNNELKLNKFIDDFEKEHIEWRQSSLERFERLQVVTFIMFFILLGFIIRQLRRIENDERSIRILKTTIDNDHSSIVHTDHNNRILYVNKTFEDTTGYAFKEVKGKDPNLLKSYMHTPEIYDSIKNSVTKALPWETEELISRCKDGSLVYEKAKFIPFFFKSKHEGFIAIKLDRTRETRVLNELTIKNEQVKAQSAVDKLTGFGNYFALTEKLEAGKDGMLVCISVRNFKMLRFFYQTKIIDAMLKALANTLKLCVDTSEINAELFRFQDDAFYIWYYGDTIVRDIELIKDYFDFNKIDVVVDGKTETLPGPKIVIGVSLAADTVQTNRLMQAVLANQQALNLGTDVYYYQENDAIEIQYYKNQLITQFIEYALENNMVIVECQGIYDISQDEKEPKFYEVLVRIVDQSGKIRYPGEFLEVAMQTQLYVQITKKVILHAFSLVERYPEYTFSVNLSSSDIADVSVRELLEEKLKLCSNPSHICFEMLESEEISDYATVNLFIKRVKSYGCKISIDDFGSGYSNYYRILELDIDNIKIDGSIIKKLPFDQNARVLVETIVSFASKQGYKIVAEFVSTPEILEQVKFFGIKYGQGFFLGKPKPMDF